MSAYASENFPKTTLKYPKPGFAETAADLPLEFSGMVPSTACDIDYGEHMFEEDGVKRWVVYMDLNDEEEAS